MSNIQHSSGEQQSQSGVGAHVVLARIVWTILGPLLLLFTFYRIVTFGNGWFTRWDGCAFGIVAVMIGCRWIEVQSGRSYTAYGEPASAEHFRHWVWILLALAMVAWILANVLGNIVLA